MNYLLDTCVFSDFFKKIPATIQRFESLAPKQIHISVVSIMEIEYGLKLNAEREKKMRPIWDILLQKIQIIPFSETCAKAAASVRSELKTSGQLIGPYDILIAGTALAHELVVVTSNLSEFKRLAALTIEDWRH